MTEPGTRSVQASERDGKQERAAFDRAKKWKTRAELATALLALVTAVLGFLVVNRQQAVTSITNNYNSSADQVKDLKDRVSTLEAENAELKSQVTESPSQPATPSDSASTGPTVAVPAIRHSGRLVYTHQSTSVDLDAPQSDPDWTVAAGDGVVEGFDYGTESVGPWGNGDETRLLFMGTKALTYSTCQEDLRGLEETGATAIGDLDAGTGFCLKTSAGRFGTVKLGAEGNGEKLVLDIKVWQKK